MSVSVVPKTTVYAARTRRTFVAAVLALAAACSRGDKAPALSDSALERDLTLAASAERPPVLERPLGDTAVSMPQSASPPGTSTNRAQPQNPPRRTPTPVRVPTRPSAQQEPAPATVATPLPTAPVPVEPAPATIAGSGGSGSGTRSLGVGTALIAQTSSQLCSLANRPGDRIVATLNRAVTGPDGATLPAGTPIVIEMATAEPPADFAFRVKGVQVDGTFIPAEGTVTSDGTTTGRRVAKGGDKGKVATGAVVGAILGRVLGGGTKGTVIGAAGGAAAGSVMAARNSTIEHCLAAGATITVTLSSPLVLPGATL